MVTRTSTVHDRSTVSARSPKSGRGLAGLQLPGLPASLGATECASLGRRGGGSEAPGFSSHDLGQEPRWGLWAPRVCSRRGEPASHAPLRTGPEILRKSIESRGDKQVTGLYACDHLPAGKPQSPLLLFVSLRPWGRPQIGGWAHGDGDAAQPVEPGGPRPFGRALGLSLLQMTFGPFC